MSYARVSVMGSPRTDPRTAPQAARQEKRTAPVRQTRSTNHPKKETRERACFLRLPVLRFLLSEILSSSIGHSDEQSESYEGRGS